VAGACDGGFDLRGDEAGNPGEALDECVKHGATLPNLAESGPQEIEIARARIVGSMPEIINSLIDAALDPDVPRYVRSKIAFGLMDRVGLMPSAHVVLDADLHTDETRQSAAETVRARLERLAAAPGPPRAATAPLEPSGPLLPPRLA
jgi:hypothetical protein